jgi:hypothetical protein
VEDIEFFNLSGLNGGYEVVVVVVCFNDNSSHIWCYALG